MSQELIKLVTEGDAAFGLVREADGTTRIGIKGELNTRNRDALKQLVVDELARGYVAFILDCTQCKYIDAVGLGVIVSISRKIEAAGGTFVIENLNEDLVTLFELTKLNTFITCRRTNAGA